MIRFFRTRFRNRYFGKYVHARKLFLFDIVLALSLPILVILAIAGRLYTPKILFEDVRHLVKIIQTSTLANPPVASTSPLTQSVSTNIHFDASVGGETAVAPGNIIPLTITIRNNETETLENVTIAIPIPHAIIDVPRLFAASRGLFVNDQLLFTPKEREGLAAILPGDTFTMTLAFPIADVPSSGDTDVEIAFTPRARGTIDGTVFEKRAETASVAVGTALALQAELRYYTNEGDQLGRGPLPPVVGRETKYGLLVTLRNTTSRVSDMTITGILTPRAVWTGKTSVSHGQMISYDPGSRKFSWHISNLDPHDAVNFFIELGLTPLAEDIGKTPALVTSITAAGRDAFIGSPLIQRTDAIDISLPRDSEAQKQGTAVRLDE